MLLLFADFGIIIIKGLRLAQPQPIQCGSPGTYLSLKDWGPCHDTESGGARSRRLYTLPWLFSTHGY